MRIAHVCLSCFYIDGYAYQENELVRQHVQDGHQVMVIASTESFGADRCLTYVEPSSYQGRDGAPVTRLPYRRLLPHKLMRKLRMHPGVRELLQQFRPEVILFHGLCGWELHAVARYKRENPDVRLYVDSHEDAHNSARSFLSRVLLHKLYYSWIIRRCRRSFDKILCVSLETMDFVRQSYGVPASDLEFFPLGGRVFDDPEYDVRRDRGRQAAGVDTGQVMLLQTGKMGRRKKLLESLRAFSCTPGSHLRLVLAGSLDEDIRIEAQRLIASDERVRFLGWKDTDELNDLLCAADVYVQPGTQSATMQMSLCARCPVILDAVPSHVPFLDGNGWSVSDSRDLARAFMEVASDPAALGVKAGRSLEIARRLLDYRTLAARLTRAA
ncbi:glycosyltransferase family 4 protein [Accumulibacter sp.]|uniref:glycosyltransferase family 4 protein n=1 Tax=Accumulibacter sp. TaxID=2053492 RepID=UPI0025FCF9CD|nr:glycosyltransferase family 4 protein [Accumulibacter sp.]MCM8594238.1 glycosyltransferase family 4 protein [Accumulibacter sp.]MDS4048382.1 glycosyltransferase family 4 protein [Accumulibacter sp.]